MSHQSLNLIEACDRAVHIISNAQDMERLYKRAIQCLGAGELRLGILNMASEAIEDEALREEVFVSDESILSFLCGIWIQFLLTEIAGVKKEKLNSLAENLCGTLNHKRHLH